MHWDYQPGKYTPPPNAFYAHVRLPIPRHHPQAVRKLLGNRGGFLKHVSSQTKADYIWYDKSQASVEIWAYNEQHLRNACRWVRRAVERLKPHFLKVFTSAESELPVLDEGKDEDQNHEDHDECVHDGAGDEGRVGQRDDDQADRGH